MFLSGRPRSFVAGNLLCASRAIQSPFSPTIRHKRELNIAHKQIQVHVDGIYKSHEWLLNASYPLFTHFQLTVLNARLTAELPVIVQAEPNGADNEPKTPTTEATEVSSVKEALRQAEERQKSFKGGKRQADSTDWIASSLTRRFGVAGGLAWLGFLTFGVVSEQVKTRLEQADEENNTKDIDSSSQKEIATPEGLRYIDLKKGGGAPPQRGYLVILDFKAYADGVLFADTSDTGKPIVFFYNSRPFTGGLCAGVEIALRDMKSGGKRRVIIPPELGFGEGGKTLRPTEHVPEKQGLVPPNATLTYELDLLRVSIPPS